MGQFCASITPIGGSVFGERQQPAVGNDSGNSVAVRDAVVPERKTVFVPVKLPEPTAPVLQADIRIELQRGATAVTVTWPASAASECAAWMRELLR